MYIILYAVRSYDIMCFKKFILLNHSTLLYIYLMGTIAL